MNQPVLSLCMPTKNRHDFLKETLENLTHEDIFFNTDKVEIVISDNCSDDSTQELCRNYVEKFPSKIRYIRQTEDLRDKNFIEVLKQAKGRYAKLNNDTIYYKENILAKIVELLENAQENVVLITNKNIGEGNISTTHLDDFNSLLESTSYQSTSIASLCVKKDEFLKLAEPDRFSHLNFAQVDIIARLANDENKNGALLIDGDAFETIYIQGKGGYNICKVFGENLILILRELIKEGYLSQEIYEKTIKETLLEHITYYHFNYDNKFTFDKNGYFKYLTKYYGTKPYFYLNYLSNIFKIFKRNIFRVEKTEKEKKIVLLNLIKMTIERKK